jgi:hypothetical protein
MYGNKFPMPYYESAFKEPSEMVLMLVVTFNTHKLKSILLLFI